MKKRSTNFFVYLLEGIWNWMRLRRYCDCICNDPDCVNCWGH